MKKEAKPTERLLLSITRQNFSYSRLGIGTLPNLHGATKLSFLDKGEDALDIHRACPLTTKFNPTSTQLMQIAFTRNHPRLAPRVDLSSRIYSEIKINWKKGGHTWHPCFIWRLCTYIFLGNSRDGDGGCQYNTPPCHPPPRRGSWEQAVALLLLCELQFEVRDDGLLGKINN